MDMVASGPLLLIALGILLVSILAKFGACYAAARLSGEDNRTALGIGALMNSRGLMELIIINIGLQKGIIGPTLFAMLVLMAIVTTVMATPLFEAVYGRAARARGELAAVGERRAAARHQRIVGGIGDDRDEGVVLRGRAHHRRAADVDILDHLVALGALGDGRFERVEIDDNEIDRGDPVFLHRRDMRRIIAHREQAAMDVGMERFHAPVHHLGKTRKLANVADVESRIAQRLGGAAGRDQFDAVAGKTPREIDDPGLVGNREKRAADGDIGHGAGSGERSRVPCPLTPQDSTGPVSSGALERPADIGPARGRFARDDELHGRAWAPLGVDPHAFLDRKRPA
eukprot:gene30475-34574_t